MAAEYKTFPVKTWIDPTRRNPEAEAQRVAEDVDRAIEGLRKEGWHMRGSPWTYNGDVFLTLWRGS